MMPLLLLLSLSVLQGSAADTLTAIARHSADAGHRALATQIIAYAPDREHVVRELLAAVSDPSDDVRNDAVRALAVLADWANEHPEAGLVIPAAPFTALLQSVSWTDRNKGVMVLVPLAADIPARRRAGARSESATRRLSNPSPFVA